ncbi:MAG: succinate dehydrogenase, hydrophobic membrane anchor protein [Gammaproteobacteria bacterium]|nr:succinate dehydrogenase, hydrophobic membrane anchor protein [Gammaproteobacteria bacterium]
MSLRTPLANARGLGSAKQGTEHFWHQRLTAVILVPLTLWFTTSLFLMSAMDYNAMITWISSPINTVLLLVFIISAYYHAMLGVRVVIEDYIHSEWQKISCLILVNVLVLLAGLVAILSVLKIFLGL